jgi:siroheme synthase (precorrin-2 oxidase/ferrochelatase)
VTYSKGFYPLALDLKGCNILYLGLEKGSTGEIQKILEAFALVTVVSPVIAQELEALQLIYGSRLNLVRKSALQYCEEGKLELGQFRLAIAQRVPENNVPVLEKLLAQAAVPLFCGQAVSGEHSLNMLEPALLKRGHFKLAVFSDGLLKPLEKHVLARIEELLLLDLDHYSLLLDCVQEASQTALPERVAALRESQEVFQALSRHNFAEAQRLVKEILSQDKENDT